jgi:transposase, IS5 family
MTIQKSFAEAEYEGKKKQTRREKFLRQMEQVVPWEKLVKTLEPTYHKGERGRPPIGLERMLRIYFLSQWYGLADEAVEDALYDSQAMRSFAGIDLSVEGAPDATTLLKFRHWLEKNELTQAIFQEVKAHLAQKHLSLQEGTIVDATIIAAPSSTKNKEKKRDPAMHQTRKGNQWYFGMKAHVGVDAQTGLVHTVVGTAANVSDVSQTEHLLHGQERNVHGDAGYTGIAQREEMAEKKSVRWLIAAKRGKIKEMSEGWHKELMVEWERRKAQVRALIEHPFHVVKNLFKYRKVRYRGLTKNTAQLHTLFALANLVLVSRQLTVRTVF